MSENLTEKEKFNASKLLLAGFLSEIIGGGTTFLIILIIGFVEPFLAAFLIIIVAAGATLLCGLIMVWLGNPFNLYWKQAKGIYEDVKDGSVGASGSEEIIRIKQIATKSELEAHLENLKQLSNELPSEKEKINGEIATIEKIIAEKKE